MPLYDWLDQRCNVLLQRTGDDDQDAAGGPLREPYTTVKASVPCLKRETGGTNDPKNGKATMENRSRVYFDPSDLPGPITTMHRIEMLDGSGNPTQELVVVNVSNVNSRSRLLHVDCLDQPV